METIVAIKDLLGLELIIPAYQRGYRWEKEQVLDLLEDINDFSQQSCLGSTSFYCLQPIVVKQKSDRCFEILDGQQRLTTILLILKNISKREQKIEEYTLDSPLESSLFSIRYETRENSQDFLKLSLAEMEAKCKECIDFDYIYQASKAIDEWFRNPDTKPAKRCIYDSDFLNNTKVIWQEVVGEQGELIDTFNRLNRGKIQLTNAELVKALFLNSSNFSGASSEQIRLSQLEIANEWDHIEYALQDEELWGFITSNSKRTCDSRIETILDLVSKKAQNELSENYTFRYFNEKFRASRHASKREATLRSNWQDIKSCYQTIADWYRNKKYYHLVGYLLSLHPSSILDLLNTWCTDRENFDRILQDKISKAIGGDRSLKELMDIGYGHPQLRNILLLHNVLTMANSKNESARFSFAHYKSERWDVEHIHATADDVMGNKDIATEWLKGAKKYLQKEELRFQIRDFLANEFQDDVFKQLFVSIINTLGDGNDNLGNLCLLDSKTNRGYGCAVYAVKRATILTKHKEGQFIPIGTLNVFNKFYSDTVDNMILWDNRAQKDYVANIHQTISTFLKK